MLPHFGWVTTRGAGATSLVRVKRVALVRLSSDLIGPRATKELGT